jgi:hypothetical protein
MICTVLESVALFFKSYSRLGPHTSVPVPVLAEWPFASVFVAIC